MGVAGGSGFDNDARSRCGKTLIANGFYKFRQLRDEKKRKDIFLSRDQGFGITSDKVDGGVARQPIPVPT